MPSRSGGPVRLLLAGVCLLQALVSSGADAGGTPGAVLGRPPNLLVLLADDLGYGDLGFHGSREIPTPHIDALAAVGVRFTAAYATAPVCSPSRAGVLTGRYQQRFGHEFNPRREQGLPLEEELVSDRLHAAGYVTGLVGKWHLGSAEAMRPLRRGFDEFFGFLEGHSDYFDAPLLRGNEPVKEQEYLTDAFAREAVSFIGRHQGSPWFLLVAFNAVHDPMQATEARLARFAHISDPQRRIYAAMTVAMDDAVGAVLRALEASGQAKDTLVVFANDNGGPTLPGTTRNASSNAPLRGSKRTLLEGGIRVPLVLSWPGRLSAATWSSPVMLTDVTATLLATAGATSAGHPPADGIDLLPFLQGERIGEPHRSLYWRFGGQAAIRQGDYKLVRYDSNADTALGANQPVTDFKLYHLGNDIGETCDLASEEPQRVAAMAADWDAWNATLVPPLWRNARDRN